jgi:hypothetical protein
VSCSNNSRLLSVGIAGTTKMPRPDPARFGQMLVVSTSLDFVSAVLLFHSGFHVVHLDPRLIKGAHCSIEHYGGLEYPDL